MPKIPADGKSNGQDPQINYDLLNYWWAWSTPNSIQKVFHSTTKNCMLEREKEAQKKLKADYYYKQAPLLFTYTAYNQSVYIITYIYVEREKKRQTKSSLPARENDAIWCSVGLKPFTLHWPSPSLSTSTAIIYFN